MKQITFISMKKIAKPNFISQSLKYSSTTNLNHVILHSHKTQVIIKTSPFVIMLFNKKQPFNIKSRSY
jgi:hypothetical protein